MSKQPKIILRPGRETTASLQERMRRRVAELGAKDCPQCEGAGCEACGHTGAVHVEDGRAWTGGPITIKAEEEGIVVESSAGGAPVRAQAEGWSLTAGAMLIRHSESRTINVFVSGTPGRWEIIALEVPSASASVEAVLDKHAHESVGRTKTLTEAMDVAEAWASNWQHRAIETEQTLSAMCDCGLIHEDGGK